MIFNTKVAIVVREDLATWQKVNVACFLSGGLVGQCPELAGEHYVDASGQTYGPLGRQPIVIFAGSPEDLTRTRRRAIEPDLQPSIFTHEVFGTSHDAANGAVVAAICTEALNLVEVGLHADRKEVDKATKGLEASSMSPYP